MELLLWVATFAACSIFWGWILFCDGAEWLEGSVLSGLFFWYGAPQWPSEGIRVFAAGTWFVQTIWFVCGLFSPAARPFGW